MSFEGYFQFICAKGHYFQESYTYGDKDEPNECLCPFCNSPVKWWNLVNDTNCDNKGYIELEEDTPRKLETCKECGHTKVIEEATYLVPIIGGNSRQPN